MCHKLKIIINQFYGYIKKFHIYCHNIELGLFLSSQKAFKEPLFVLHRYWLSSPLHRDTGADCGSEVCLPVHLECAHCCSGRFHVHPMLSAA